MGGSGGGSWGRLGDIRSLEKKAKEALRPRKNVFISFVEEDLDEVNLLRAHAKNENSKIEFNDHSVRVPYDSDRAEYIKQKISERIARATVCVVYLSDNTAQSDWVKWEVDESLKRGRKVIGVHPQGKPVTNMPGWVKEYGIQVVQWSDLAEALKD